MEWEAAIAAGATLDELYKWESREYPKSFMAKVVTWFKYHRLIRVHQEDAARPKKGRK